jgi:hypothetical protein
VDAAGYPSGEAQVSLGSFAALISRDGGATSTPPACERASSGIEVASYSFDVVSGRFKVTTQRLEVEGLGVRHRVSDGTARHFTVSRSDPSGSPWTPPWLELEGEKRSPRGLGA